MRTGKKIDWKAKLVASILGGTLLVIGLLFGITYTYFVNKLTASNERIVNLTFQQAEKELKTMLENAERQLNLFSNDTLSWEFSSNRFRSAAERTAVLRKIVESFDDMIVTNPDIYGAAILSGDGRTAVSTAEGKSGTEAVELTESLWELLETAKEAYPYVTWISNLDVEIPESCSLYRMVNRPVLLGVKAIGDYSETGEDSYLLVTLGEESIRESYALAIYSGSESALLDENGRMISATGDAVLGTVFEPDDRNQNITYELSYKNWTLVNQIPKAEYLREARGLRNFGILLAALASAGVLAVALIWSRRYTRPIQNLMEQMEAVGREQLEIAPPVKTGLPELYHLNEEFYAMVQKLKSYMKRLQETEQEKAKEELRALQYQINPHFLYNSLNSIRWMAMMTNNTKVADALVTLSKLIVPILRDPSFTWKLENELEFLQNYVEMMQLRFGNEMEYHLECPEELYEELFPRFLLQPVIENCFVHGSSSAELRHIYLRIQKEERFAVEIQNTGVCIEAEKLREMNETLSREENQGKNIGLSNIRKRLKLLYGENGKIWMESSAEKGLTVYLRF
ncbi:MAG: sensor histidine kinase [Eubacteriales bacterium]|nr:sensor histidine kinase [Eubacteriales bacterium]